MRQITVNVPSSDYRFFTKMLGGLGWKYMEHSTESDAEPDYDSKEYILQAFSESLQELKQIKAGKLQTRPVEELLNEL